MVHIKSLASAFSLPKLSLCFVFRARNILECVWCSAIALPIATAVFGKESPCVSIPHQCTALRAHTMVWWLQRQIPCTVYEPKCTSMAPSNSVMRNGQATTIPLGSNWFAEIDVAIGMEDFDHSGFVIERTASNIIRHSGFKIVKGMIKIILAKFKRTINQLEDTQLQYNI